MNELNKCETSRKRLKGDLFMEITIREPGSAITHFIACILSLMAAIPLLMKAHGNATETLAMTIFTVSMILLYGASTLYHSISHVSAKVLRIFRKMDHIMIFVLIAGSYTPICMVALGGKTGYALLTFIWILAAVGILLKACWITCPKWFSSVIYIAMGWTCFPLIHMLWGTLSHAAFGWLLAGGIIYTIGGIVYALKLSIFNSTHRYFGSHEIFHLFVMGGSLCHFICMYLCM